MDELPPNVRLNEDAGLVSKIRERMKAVGGHCPCRLMRTPDTICICREFREQIADPEFEGYCHCRLYYKEKVNNGSHSPEQ